MTTPLLAPMLAMPQGAEWLVILLIVVLVFGAAKLPDLARSSGQALRIFKTETKNLRDDDETDADPEADRPVRAELPAAEDSAAEAQRRRDDTTA